MEDEKENLIRLIQSGDVANLELAIQLNIGQRLLDWELIWDKGIRPYYLTVPLWALQEININSNLINRLICAMILFSSAFKSWRTNINSVRYFYDTTLC